MQHGFGCILSCRCPCVLAGVAAHSRLSSRPLQLLPTGFAPRSPCVYATDQRGADAKEHRGGMVGRGQEEGSDR